VQCRKCWFNKELCRDCLITQQINVDSVNEKEEKLNERKKVNKQKYNTSPYLQVKTYADVLMSNAAKTTPDQIVLMPDTTFSNNDSIDSRSPLTSSLNSTPYLQALVLKQQQRSRLKIHLYRVCLIHHQTLPTKKKQIQLTATVSIIQLSQVTLLPSQK